VRPSRTERVVTALGEGRLLVGVGSVAGLQEADRSHETAGHALAAATQAAPVVRWDEVVGEGPLALLDPALAASFAESFLARLATAPGQDVVPTLRSLLRHHGSRLKVAEELGVHRNTVRNRLEQIEEALGRSLDDPQVRVSAWIALQVGADPG
jgi:DNA-binding PucR family transcriptional regulator